MYLSPTLSWYDLITYVCEDSYSFILFITTCTSNLLPLWRDLSWFSDIFWHQMLFFLYLQDLDSFLLNLSHYPQTWEDPNHTHPETNAKGDNDPLDVCEIGERVARRGEVIQVKVLGTVALIDEGTVQWTREVGAVLCLISVTVLPHLALVL